MRLLGGALALAALLIGANACSRIDNPAETAGVSSVHVTLTVGTPGTKVSLNGSPDVSLTLTFTPEDQLFVRGDLAETSDGGLIYLSGFLSTSGEKIFDDGKSATFEGELTVRKQVESADDIAYSPAEFDFTGYNNPLDACLDGVAQVQLVQNGSTSTFFVSEGEDYLFHLPETQISSTLEELIGEGLDVIGFYYCDGGPVSLQSWNALFEISISGLTSGATYEATFIEAENETEAAEYPSDVLMYGAYGELTPDDEGTISFYVAHTPNYTDDAGGYYFIVFQDYDNGETYVATLGQKALETNKLYRVTRAAVKQ